AGEVRRVPDLRQRLAEAVRLGFRHALVPPDPGPVPDGIEVVEVGDLGAALLALGMTADLPSRRTDARAAYPAARGGRPAGSGPRGRPRGPRGSRPVHLRPISPNSP
ncbi:MAG: hypothetical protein J2P24_16920, partial [Streptosporangiales bacterium]|nr:hypothetical protein [Streptosporangiales bacterium]